MIRTERLLAAYPDAVTKFPGWFCSEWRCNSCCLTVKPERVTYTEHHDGACGGKCEVVNSMPDLTKPENLHHLLALADAVDDDGLSETDTSGGIVRHHILRNGKGYFGTGGNAGAPGARTDAAFNALEKALGVKV